MDSATIVSAALDSRQLEDSINKLVATVASKTKEMADNFTKEVARMEQAVKNIGNIKIDSGGTADGGSSRRTSKQKEEETQVKATTQAYKEQRTVVGELAMSFDNLNTAITKSNSKLAAKFDVTEQQKVQQLEAQRTAIEDKIVARQIEIDESYRSQLATLSKTRSELESKANLTSKEQADLKHVTTEWERINKIVRDISSRPIVAADDPTGSIGRLQQQLVETNKQLDESRKRIQEMNFERAKMYDGSLSGLVQNAQATMKYQNDTLKKSFEDLLKKPTHDVDEMRAKMERLQTFLNNIKPLNIFSPELIANGERAINKLKNEIQKFNDKPTKQAFADALKLPDRTQSEIITKINRIRDAIKGVEGTKIVSEAEIARANSLIESLRDKWSKLYNAPRDRKLRIEFADALKMPTNNIDEIAAKLMRLQHILQEMRGMEVLSPEQISKGNQQISALLSKLEAEMSLRQQINAVEQADMQNAQKRIELEAKYGEEVAKAAAIANDWLQKNKEAAILNKEGTFVIQDPKVGQTVGQSIEAQLLAYKAINGELNLELEVQKAIQNTVESIERAEQRRIALAQGGNATSNKSFADYEDLRTAIAAVLRVRESEVSLANSEDASYKALSLTLKQLKQAYESLDASQRKSENADALIASIHETQRAMQEIQNQMSRPVNLANVLALPEKNIDDISYKVQMLRAYAQGINIETNAGNEELRRVMSTIEGLNEGLKNAQKTTKQVAIESNSIKFDNIAKMPAEGLKQVGAKIKEVKQYINELKNQPIVDEKNLKRAEALYDRLIKQSQKLNETKGTHSNVNDALNVRVKTLDDIAKKMQRLQAIRQNLDINKQKADIDRINAALGELKKQQDGVLQRNANMIKSNNALGRSWNYMKNRLAFYFTVGASTQFIKNLIEVRSQYEMNERALGILINSAERGTQIFNELSQMALVSPYTLIELSNAAKQLTAYDIAAKDVVDTTRRLADMASAVGVPMERLTYALGQIKAYGYLNSRDARMFANAGIPLVRELSKYYSELEGKVVSVGDVYDRMKKKAIDYNSVMAVVTKMTDEGGKFFDFQAKMADTLKVRLANLTLAWNNMLNDIGASQQGVLTSGIGILKDLFLHWQDIYGAIQRVVLAIGLWKGAQALALLAIGELNTQMGMQVLLGKKLQTSLSGLAGSTKNLVSGYAAAGAALLFVVADAIMTYQRNAEEIEKLNKVIVDGAKESANSIYELIESAEMSYARLSARTGKLPKPDAEKTWDALREQIELSAISAKNIIPELIKIEDLNERVTKAFNLAERIAEANNKLIDLDGKLDISQNSILFGLFGEGLVEDIDDFNERLRISAQTEELLFKSTGSVITDVVQGLTGFFSDMKEKLGSSTEEAEREIKNFAHNAADAIKDELGEEGLKDSIQVNEAVSRVLIGIEQQFPQIKGKGKALFESMYNDIMAKEFNGAVDKQAYYYKLFLERLKKDHGSAFQGVTEDIDRETFRWSDAQMKAIKKTADRIKEDIPEAYQDSVTEILNDLNSREFKMRIVAEFATSSLDDINKAFRRRFIEAGTDAANAQIDATQKGLDKIKDLSPWGGGDAGGKTISQKETENLQKFGSLMRKQNESDLDYQERIRKERQKKLDIQATEAKIIAANTGREDEGAKAVLASAQEQKKAADDWLDAASQVEKWGGYDFSTKKENTAATKAQHAAETELQKALKDELQLIDRVRSQYKKLVDAGANSGEALAYVTNQFANSLAHVNNVLGKNGIPLFDISKFAGTDNPNALLDMLKLQLDSAKIAKNIKPEEIKELEVKYSEIVVDAKAYNLTKITKGLNNELDRLKDEYELAVSLDADPELGDVFADFMGIDKQKLAELPRSYNQLLSKLQSEIDNIFSENDIDLKFDLSEMINKEKFDKWIKDNGHNLEDGMAKSLNAVREYLYKILNDEIKGLSELVGKYGDAHAKIEKIYAKASRSMTDVISVYGNIQQKTQAINLANQLAIEDDPATISRLRDELNSLAQKVADDSDAAQNLLNAIFRNQKESVGNALWEGFKSGDYYSVIFDDLSRASTKALQGMKLQLDEIKDKIKESPEAMKAFMSAYGKLREELIARDPFRGIVDSLNDMRIAHQQVILSQASLDSAIENAKAKESNLNRIREKEPRNVVAIYNAEKELSKAKKDVAERTAQLIQAQNNETSAQANFKKAVKDVNGAINKLGDALKQIGETLDNTTGNVIKFIGDIFGFVTFVSESMQSVSTTAAKSIQAIEKASVILAIISAAIQLIQELNSIIPDSFDQYEKAAEKQAEINKLTDAVVQYQLAVLAARMAEENWFSTNSLKQLKNYYSIGSEALDNYNRKLLESQAVYQNEQSGGWLTKFAYWSSPGTWISKITGIQGEWADAISLLGSGMFGMEAQMGQLGIWLTEHGNKDLYDYVEGFTAAINNLRIETRESSSGFLGTGIGGHSQETEDLIEWMKRELGLDLFDKDFMINEEAYQVIMDKYADKLVGETKATLEALHELTEKWNEYVEQLQDYVDSLYSPLVNNMTDAMWEWYNEGKNALTSFKDYASETFKDIVSDMMKTIILSNFAEAYANDIKELYTNYAKGGISEENLIKNVALRTGEMMESFEENIPILERLLGTASSVLGQYGITLKSAENIELSALQQGIQGITENTAGALEAYMNGVSQQVYYQSDILTQIRDILVGGDADIQLGVQGQMLLQLQQSFQVQMAIQSILEGWSSPNGLAVRVEMA